MRLMAGVDEALQFCGVELAGLGDWKGLDERYPILLGLELESCPVGGEFSLTGAGPRGGKGRGGLGAWAGRRPLRRERGDVVSVGVLRLLVV